MSGPKPPFRIPGFSIPGLFSCFQALRVSCAIWENDEWHVVFAEPNLVEFELEHSLDRERARYNARCLKEAQRSKCAVLGTHAGAADLFVPIVIAGRTRAVIVSGPFLTRTPTAEQVQERFFDLTGRQGHPGDPRFSHYVSVYLATLLLEGTRVRAFERLLTCFAQILAGESSSVALLDEAVVLRAELEKVRSEERSWEAARAMIDARTSRAWASPYHQDELRWLGLSKLPNRALVGLVVGRHADHDPVSEVIQRHLFQRAAVALARANSNVVSGVAGEHGVTFLLAETGSEQRREQKLSELSESAALLARKWGLKLHLGLSTLPNNAALSDHYRVALGAAENALSEGVKLSKSMPTAKVPRRALGNLRQELAKLVEEQPRELPARFERYLEMAALRSGYQIAPLRVELDACFDRIAEPLLESGALDARGISGLWEALEQSSERASTVAELLAAYRRAVADASEAVQNPVASRHERHLRVALDHIQRHYAERLSLRSVARLTGFAPNYFSSLFKARQKLTFEGYLRRLRIERAKHLLADTELPLARVAQLCGLGTRVHLSRAFKRALSTTPAAYRKRTRQAPRAK